MINLKKRKKNSTIVFKDGPTIIYKSPKTFADKFDIYKNTILGSGI